MGARKKMGRTGIWILLLRRTPRDDDDENDEGCGGDGGTMSVECCGSVVFINDGVLVAPIVSFFRGLSYRTVVSSK